MTSVGPTALANHRQPFLSHGSRSLRASIRCDLLRAGLRPEDSLRSEAGPFFDRRLPAAAAGRTSARPPAKPGPAWPGLIVSHQFLSAREQCNVGEAKW
jgi:hypothetical protein